MEILLETKDYLAVVKPADLVSEQVGDGTGLGDLLAERNGGYIGVIHRMDRGVGGVTVYAKNPASAARLSEQVREGRMKKTYLAVTEGIPEEAEGELRDLLFYDRKRSKVFVVDRKRNGVKEAILRYRVLKTATHPETGEPLALLEVHPITGRTHQIRVQLASRRLPLLGDRKYGGHGRSGISLVCHRIEIPTDGRNTSETVCYEPSGEPWDWLR
jgi:23S rRNA pseudouridine1911/1915/1917 synthase